MLLIVVIIIVAWVISQNLHMILGVDISKAPDQYQYYNITEGYSPIMLCLQWNTLVRIMLTIGGTAVGIISNGFFVATFYIAEEVRKLGNVFLVCVGLSEFFITAGVMITSSSVILSKEWDTLEICQGMQALVSTSTYCYSMFYFLVALVTWCRVNQIRKVFIACLPCLMGLICLLVLVISAGLAMAGTYYKYEIDYCQRHHHGNALFRFSTTMFHVLSFFFSTSTLIVSYVKLEHQTRGSGRYRRSYQYQRDVSMIKLNVVMNLLFVAFWSPFMIVVNYYPDAPNSLFYTTAMVAILRSILASGIYCMSNNIFSRSFSSLFNYCFCKISIQSNRPRTKGAATRTNGDVKTHILMQPAANDVGQVDL